jgi:hypothetical protein
MYLVMTAVKAVVRKVLRLGEGDRADRGRMLDPLQMAARKGRRLRRAQEAEMKESARVSESRASETAEDDRCR